MRNRAGRFMLKLGGVLMCLTLVLFNYSEPMRLVREMSDDIYLDALSGAGVLSKIAAPFTVSTVPDGVPVSSDLAETLRDAAGGAGDPHQTVTVELFGLLPVKRVNVHYRQDIYVMPGGESVGVTLYTKGALVVGMGTVLTENGERICPAELGGVQVGDVIIEANGQEVKNAETLIGIFNRSEHKAELTLLRGSTRLTASVTPVKDASDGVFKIGMWVRDSTAGIGTLSFYVMSTKKYGALGHAITDVDTGALLSVRNGEVVESNVLGVVQSSQGVPGEIKGTFTSISRRLGFIEKNTEFGIFGELYEDIINPLYPNGVPVAYPEEVETGPAKLLTTVDDSGVRAYDCEIIKLYPQTSAAPKGLVIEITDSALIEKTGGIVQGMSGSPILQNGKLVGIITHVFVNDSTKGYCVYALWMAGMC
ncbi:MAG: SpoIVB peptidase [Clostridiaceae bacterium]|nr:SpoIVB peptidase [Eubacteriales bacterium]